MSGAPVESFDAVVVGVGGMGSAALYHLARKGLRVLGLEQYDIPHSLGSSHGHTRIIRKAYFEHPSYVPLLQRAYALWDELARESATELLIRTGSVDASATDDVVFRGSLESCLLHGLDHEVHDGRALARRVPGLRLPDDFQAVYQPDGGFLLSEACIVAHVNRARKMGARVRAREEVLGWSPVGPDEIEVRTSRGRVRTGALIVTAGAWLGSLVPSLKARARPERQVIGWFDPLRPEDFGVDRFPVFNIRVPEGHFYGFPEFDLPGMKLGLYHHLHESVEDPTAMDRTPGDRDEAPLRAFLERYAPGAAGDTMGLRCCMFTNTPDEHFLVGPAPGQPGVWIGGGFSGHGYKFCSVIGEILADLAAGEDVSADLSLFHPGRFAVDG